MIKTSAFVAILYIASSGFSPGVAKAAETNRVAGNKALTFPRVFAQMGESSWNRLMFSPDGSKLVAIGVAGAFVWDPQTGHAVGTPIIHRGIISAQLAANGRILFTVGDVARQWDVSSGAMVGEAFGPPLLLNGGPITASSDGLLVAAMARAGDRLAADLSEVRVLDTFTRKCVCSIPHSGNINFILFSPGNRYVLTAEATDHRPHGGGEIYRLWNLRDGSEVMEQVKTNYNYDTYGAPGPAGFSPDGTRIVIASKVGFAIYDIALRRRVTDNINWNDRTRDGVPDLFWVAWSSRGDKIVTVNGSELRVWDGNTAALIGGPFRCGSFGATVSPDANSVIAAYGEFPSKGRDPYRGQRIAIFDVASGAKLQDLATGYATAATFAPDGSSAAISFMTDGAVRLFDIPTAHVPL